MERCRPATFVTRCDLRWGFQFAMSEQLSFSLVKAVAGSGTETVI
jgi:hypothetical protein